jgi:N-acetylglucosaminyl-diphospho-decaprenol L-rhamnosyltransferase
MTSAGVSIVVPHYGDPQPARNLVARLRTQTIYERIEVIVVDDCSPEPFPELDDVIVIQRQHNGGFGSAVNSGAERARHDLLLVLNSDVEIDRSFVEDLLKAAEPWLPAVLSPQVIGNDGRQLWSGRHFPRVRHQFVEWLTPLARWRDRPPLHEAVGHDTRAAEGVTTVVDWVVGAALLVPTAEFRAVGGFDERFFMNSEEVDLQRRLRARGLPSVLLSAPVALHEGGGSSDPVRRRRWLVESRLQYAQKWGHPHRTVLSLVGATGVNLLWNGARRLLGRPVHPLRTAREELQLLHPRTQAAASRGWRSTLERLP